MQRPSLAAVLSITLLTTVPACGTDGDQADSAKADGGANKAGDTDKAPARAATGAAADSAAGPTQVAADSGAAAADSGAAEAGPAEAGVADSGAAEAGAAEAGAAEAGVADSGAAEAGAAEAGEEDPVPPLFEIVKSLDNDDAAANKALTDALAAGASKIDAAKVANERGESLMTKGESERAEAFFTWSRDAHSKYANSVYNLAKLAAYAGDLELAKEHLAELEKRGNKMLMKKVGVEPAFAPLHDDPDVRKIYEQK